MTYIEAQSEFNVRLYHWAKAAQDREISAEFPRFRHCSEWPSRTCTFLKSLDLHSRSLLGRALLLKRHKKAAKLLGEVTCDEALGLLAREEEFRLGNPPGAWGGAHGPRVHDADKRALATRPQLKKALRAQFIEAYGGQCLPADPRDDAGDVVFRFKCRGWIIVTWFEFGRWAPEIAYHHSIWTGKLITQDEPAVLFANSIGFGLNYGNDIGLGLGWDAILAENIKPVSAEVMTHCELMFVALPTLLEGLELDQLRV